MNALSSAIDEREDVQKKTFGKWVNSMLSKGNYAGVKDVFTDLRDGTVLLNLLEVLTKTQIKREKGRMRVHHLNNVSRALELLKEQKVRLVNISNNEIVDGNCKITLALCWSIFLHWQVNDIMKELMASTHQSNLEKALLQWCQQNTQPYPGVEIKNFSTCWSDGRAFVALVHRFKPDLVSYGSCANMNIMNRLETIFTVCQEELGIERLLDPEDVNTSVPDKKSVMMYVMCLFQALTCGSLEPPPLPQTIDLEASIEMDLNNSNNDAIESKEIESYNSIVEEVLGWLLQASDVVEKFGAIGDDLSVVKGLFQEHERFMLTLTEHQADVGEVLQEGSRLLTELKLKTEDAEHVKLHMKILNDKWEELRIASMSRQNAIHEKLMSLQLSELASLKEFLTKTEDEMSKISNMSFNIEVMKQRHQELSKNIIEMQSRVISFSDLVLVVDSNSDQQAESTEATLEDQLQGLSERWSVICNWTERRSKLLNTIQENHDRWSQDSQRISSWLKVIEGQLMNNEALGDERDYALSSNGSDNILERYEQLQRLQLEMEEKLTEINTLTADTQAVSAEFNDPYKTELMQDKWGVVSEILQAQSHRMSKYKQNPKIKKAKFDDFMDVSILHQVVKQDEPKAKRLKTLTWLNENKQNLIDWIERTKALISTTFDELSVEEQIVLYEDVEHEFQNYTSIFQKYIESMNDIGDPIDPDLTTKWQNIESSLIDRKILIDNLVEEKLQHTRILDLQQGLQQYATWLDTSQPNQSNRIRLSTELKIKLKTLQSHDSKIKEFEKLIADGKIKSTGEAADVISFYHEIQQRLQERQEVLENLGKLSSEQVEDINTKLVNDLLEKTKEILEEKKKSTINDVENQIHNMKSHLEEFKQINPEHNPQVDEAIKAIEKEILEAEKNQEAHNRWKEKLASLESWLDQVNVFIVAETPGVGDCDIIEAQLEQSNALQKDIETLDPKYNEILNEGKGFSNDDITIRARILKLVGTWTETVKKAKEQNQLLDECARKTAQVTKSFEEINKWLATIKENTASEAKGIKCDTSIELSRLTRKYRALSEQIDIKVPLFNEINEVSNDLLVAYNSTMTNNAILMLQPTQQPGPINLAKSVTTLNSTWNNLTEIVKRNFEKLRDITELYGEFRSLTATMTDSLDRLERKIHIDEFGSGDMEELSMQIDDLDNTIPAIQNRLAQIQSINSQLSDSGLNISEDIQHLEARFEGLHDKYLDKRSELDSQVTALSSIESTLMTISKEIDLIVRDYHDECGGSVNSIKTQLETQLTNLNQIKSTISATLNEETRTRLELQRQQLETKLNRIKSKLGSYDGTKLEKMWQSLRNIQCSLAFLELGSVEIDDVNRQIACVEREYASLKSLKSQLEQILKEGRKKANDDSKLSTQLDSIKGLYNQLGIQVSVIKNNLDQGLDLSTKIHTGINVLRDYLDRFSQNELENMSQTEMQNLIQSLPMTKEELSALDESIYGFSKLIDPILLQDLQETNDHLKNEYADKTEKLVEYYKSKYGKDIKNPQEEFDKMEKTIKEMKQHIDGIKFEYNVEGCYDVMTQINDLTDKIENLRSTVIHSVTLNSDPFSNKNDLNVKFNRIYDQFNNLTREVQSLEKFEIHENEDDLFEELELDQDQEQDLDEPTPLEQAKMKRLGDQQPPSTGFSSQFGQSGMSNQGSGSGARGGSGAGFGIVNPCFDEDDTNELNVTVPIKPSGPGQKLETVTETRTVQRNIIEEEWNVAYTIARSSSDDDADEDDSEPDEEENSRITVINTGKVSSSVSGIPRPSDSLNQQSVSSGGNSSVSTHGHGHGPMSNITNTSKNVKIVEIRENEIVQGILRMEPIITEAKPENREYENYLRNLNNSKQRLADIQSKLISLNAIPEPRDRINILDDLQENLESMILFISHGDSLAMKLSKEDLAHAKLVLDHNSKFKMEWTNTKSTIENSKMTCLWLETLLLECQILSSAPDLDTSLNSKIDQLNSHGVPFALPEQHPSVQQKQIQSPKSPNSKNRPVPIPTLTEDEQELVKLESFIDNTMKSKINSLDDIKQIEISVSKMHRPTIKLLKNRHLPNDSLTALDAKWKKLLEYVSKSRTEIENKPQAEGVKSTLKSVGSPPLSPNKNKDKVTHILDTEKLAASPETHLVSPSSSTELPLSPGVKQHIQHHSSKIPVLVKETTVKPSPPQKPVTCLVQDGHISISQDTKNQSHHEVTVPTSTPTPLSPQPKPKLNTERVEEPQKKEANVFYNLNHNQLLINTPNVYGSGSSTLPSQAKDLNVYQLQQQPPQPSSSSDPRQQRAGSLPRWVRQDPVELITKWIDEVNEMLNMKLNVTNEQLLRNHVSNLKTAEHQMIGKKIDADKLDKSNDQIAQIPTTVHNLAKKLPLERQTAEQKLSLLRKLKLQLDTTASWILEVRAQLATAKYRSDNEKGLIIQGVLTRVTDKEPEVHDVIQNYRNLQYEVESTGLVMDSFMTEKMRQLTEDWNFVLQQQQLHPQPEQSALRPISLTAPLVPVTSVSSGPKTTTTASTTVASAGSGSSGSGTLGSDAKEATTGTFAESAESADNSTKSGSSLFNVQATRPATSGSGAPSASGISDKVVEDLRAKKRVDDGSPSPKTAAVECLTSSSGVRIPASSLFLPIHSSRDEIQLLQRQQEEQEQQRERTPYEQEHDDSRLSLSPKETLSSSLLTTPTLASRSRSSSVEGELNLIHVADSLEANMTLNLKQLKQQIVLVGDTEHIQFILEKQKNVQQELEMKRPQLDELMMTAENLKSQENRQQLYNKLTRLMDHWTETNQAVTSRLRALEECLHDSINWNCQFDHIQSTLQSQQTLKDEVMLNNFSDFLSSTSNLIVKYCGEDTSKLNSTLTLAQLLRIEWKLNRCENGQPVDGTIQDLEGELNSMTFDLNTSDETKQRWNALRNRVISMRSKISSTLYNNPPLTSQTSQHQHRNSEIELRELTEWVIRKEIQLPGIDTNADLANLEVQMNSLVNYIQELECKRPIIESCLRQQQYQQQFCQQDDKSSSNAVQRDSDRLGEIWNILCTKSEQLHGSLQEAILKQKKWTEELDDCSARLATAEAIKSRWTTITAAADKSSILDQLKTFREHIWTTNKSIQDLNTHFKSLDLKKEPQRLIDLNNRLTYLLQDSPVPLLVNNYISHPWEKLHANGVPYYVNHSTETTQWDHPSMTQLLSQLTDLNIIRFSAYRTALKLRAIQKHLQLDRISLTTLITAFENLGLRGTNDRLLDIQDMTFTIQTLHMNSESCAYITDMTLNWILNVYDGSRTGHVRNLSFKIGLVLLSKGSMEDKFKYLFRLVADMNKTVDQRKLGLLLHDCMQIPRVLGEIASFGGSNIEPSVRSCFEKCGEGGHLKINEFIEWTKQEPQSIVWLPVLHRVAASEGQSHNAKCNVCKCVPIIGLRYRCLKCFNFDMCQKCFFSGKKSKSHKLSHPMQEYCIESTSGEDVRDFTRALKNKFKSKRKLEKSRKLGYLPVQSLLEGDTFESPLHSPQHSLSPELSHHRFVIDNNLSGSGNNGVSAPGPPTVGSAPARDSTHEIMNNNRGSSQSAWIQNIHSTQTPESDDEHSLIAAYCQSLSKPTSIIPRSPIQVLSSIDADHSIQLESVIRSLEQENNNLQMEYNRLIAKKSTLNSPNQIINNIENNNILNEARLLRVHKGRLEARMQILEDHNRQLEQQLVRLRQLLDEPKSETNRTGTLQSKSVIASELDINSPNNLKSTNQLHDKNNSATTSPTSTYGGSNQPPQIIPTPDTTNLPIYSKNLAGNHPPQQQPLSPQQHSTSTLSSQHQVEDLLSRASEVGRAVGELVNVMTDEEEE